MKTITLTEKRFFEWHEDTLSVTLRNRGGSYGGGSEVLIVEKEMSEIYTSTKASFHTAFDNSDVAQTLVATDYKDPQTVTYQQTTGPLCASGYNKLGTQEAASDMYVTSVDCRNGNEADTNGSLQSKASNNINSNNVCRTGSVVRRLTPMECERLQGFPDNYTNIGAWTDTKGKPHKESADSARYKALGNSICLPFWAWLLKRISAQYERPATLGSLFDGIGGFPLVWERVNGRGSARWASEIEEFPIAVTKYHFGEE